jgi:hypothetical protein
MRLRGRLARGLPGIVAAVLLATPAAADAHLRSGTVAVDYQAIVSRADTSAYAAQIFQSDRALSLTVKTGHLVVLLGYLGEPVFRLDAAGLWVNADSPTAVVLRLTRKSQGALTSVPRWRLERGRNSVVWQDRRAQALAPGVGHGVWSVPLIVDRQRARLAGVLRRFPASPAWPWLGVLAVLLAAGLSPLALRRRRLAATTFAVAAAVASVVTLVAFMLDAYASQGTWIEGFDALVFLGVGVWVLRRGPEHWHVAAAIGLGLVALAVGLLDGAIFFHPVVLAILPATAIRVFDVVAIGAGLDALALGSLIYAETARLTPREEGFRIHELHP